MTINEYKKAVWDFLLEHSDITDSGALFIKFHCDDRKNLEKRIIARHNGYHRNNVIEKENVLIQKKIDHIKKKNIKKSKYNKAKKVRKIKRKILSIIGL